MKILLLLPLLLGFSVPATAHNIFNGGGHGCGGMGGDCAPQEVEEGEGRRIDRENTEAERDRKQGQKGEGI